MQVDNICCRSCGNKKLDLIISFGYTPLADGLLTIKQLKLPEYTAPLNLAFCSQCRSQSQTRSLYGDRSLTHFPSEQATRR